MYNWLFVAGLVFGLAHQIFYGFLVRQQYLRHRHEWEKDGRPQGFFWLLPVVYRYVPRTVSQRQRWLLLRTTPAWVNKDAYAWWLLYGYRITLGWALALIVGPPIEILLQDMFR
jgi:hypothetical protein